jgi:hypothetical protein
VRFAALEDSGLLSLQSYIAGYLNHVELDPQKLHVLDCRDMENQDEDERVTPTQQDTRKLSLASALSILNLAATRKSSWAPLVKKRTNVITSMSPQSPSDWRCFANVKVVLGIAIMN